MFHFSSAAFPRTPFYRGLKMIEFSVGVLLAAMSLSDLGAEEAAKAPAVKGYPAGVTDELYECRHDGSRQPTLYWAPTLKPGEKVPLLVALHTWSGNYRQAGGEAVYAEWCINHRWAFVHPNFRGTNHSSEAMGSDLAVLDIYDVVQWAKERTGIDTDRIYLTGASGGGHAALMAAGRFPEVWAGVSAWVGITDIAAWHQQTSEAGRTVYSKHIEQALGGAPADSPGLQASAWHRSPLKWLPRATGVPLDINHGIQDGRSGSVPFTHSLHAWNRLVPENRRLSDETIATFYETLTVPAGGAENLEDSLYGERQPLYRLTHDNTRVTIFDGGHELIHLAALNWLAAQRRGKPADWAPAKLSDIGTTEDQTKSGL